MDMTKNINKARAPYDYYNSFKKEELYIVDLANSDLSDARKVGTHQVVTIPKGFMLVGGRTAFNRAVTSGGAATVQIKFNGSNLTKAFAIADMTEGKGFAFDLVAGINSKVIADSATVDIVIAGADLTDGEFGIVLELTDTNKH